MTNPTRPLLLIAAVSLCAAVSAPAALAGDACRNEQLRAENNSQNLPECRAYELVSTDLNHASLGIGANGYAMNGDTVMYYSVDAPETADFGSVSNLVVSKRDAVKGWSGASIDAPVHGPTGGYFASITQSVSSDLKSVLTTTDQSPDGSAAPAGLNLWLTRADGSSALMNTVGNPFVDGADAYQGFETLSGYYDFSNVFFKPALAQLSADTTPGFTTYQWANGHLRVLGIMPDGNAAPGGSNLPQQALLPPISRDGQHALFIAGGEAGLFLRNGTGDEPSVDVTAPVPFPDSNPPSGTSSTIGMLPDGSKVLFTSHSELTADANTGRSGGAQTDAGNDIYSYDIASGKLKDLTISTNPADVATGANVLSVVGSTLDGSSIYFTATGVLAEGATPGRTSLYVLRGEHVEFVADGTGIPSRVLVSPDGTAIAFSSTGNLTGYDNTDPHTDVPHKEVFVLGPSHTLECASCRPDGARPTADSELSGGSSFVSNAASRAVTNGGEHVFFETSDEVLPRASSGLIQVFDYSHGKISALSRLDAPTRAYFLDATDSGDNVFIATHDELVPNKDGGDFMVYDARIGGGFPQPTRPSCELSSCQGPPTAPPVLPSAASVTFVAAARSTDGNAGPPTGRVSASRSLSVKGRRVGIKVKVPGKGRLIASGSGLRTAKLSVATTQIVTLKVSLSAAATRTLTKRKTFSAKAKVVFVDAAGNTSSATVSLTFKPATTRKGS